MKWNGKIQFYNQSNFKNKFPLKIKPNKNPWFINFNYPYIFYLNRYKKIIII